MFLLESLNFKHVKITELLNNTKQKDRLSFHLKHSPVQLKKTSPAECFLKYVKVFRQTKTNKQKQKNKNKQTNKKQQKQTN